MKKILSLSLALALCTGVALAQHTATTNAVASAYNDVYVDQDKGPSGDGTNFALIDLYLTGENEIDVFQVADGDLMGAANEAFLSLEGTSLNDVFVTQFNTSIATTAQTNAVGLDILGGGQNVLVFHQDGEDQAITASIQGTGNGAAGAVGKVWLAQQGIDQLMTVSVNGDDNGLLLGQYGSGNSLIVDLVEAGGITSNRNLVEVDQGGFLSDRTNPEQPVMTLGGPTDDASASVSIFGDDNEVDIVQYIGPGLVADVVIDGVFNEIDLHQQGVSMSADVDVLQAGYNTVWSWQEGSGHSMTTAIQAGSANNVVTNYQYN